MTERDLPPELARALDRLDELIHRFEQHPEPAVQDRAVELLQAVDVVHRAGLRQIVTLLRETGQLPLALGIPEARLVIDLYELADADETAGEPSDRGECSPAGPAVTGAASGSVPQAGFVPLSKLELRRRPRLSWRSMLSAKELPPDSIRGFEIDQHWILVANVGGVFQAYRDACPGTPLPLRSGRVADGIVHCPWHRCQFDLRDGTRVDVSGPGLTRVPIAIEDGEIRVGIQEDKTR